MLNRQNDLITNRGLLNTTDCLEPSILADNLAFVNQIRLGIVDTASQLPNHPGFEIHPYKGLLQYQHQDKMIIGTFPPISYLIDVIKSANPALGLSSLKQPTPPHQHITRPTIPFFHGNINALWSVFLTPTELTALNLLANRTAKRDYLIARLLELGIYYDDIIKSTQRKLSSVDKNIGNLGYTYEDVNLKNICVDDKLIIDAITSSALKGVCFTNGATFRTNGLQLYTQPARAGIVNVTKNDALSIFIRGCQDLGLTIEMQCLPHYGWTPISLLTQADLSTKLIFELRIKKGSKCIRPELRDFKQKEFTIITPFSPAAIRFMGNHPIVVNYRLLNGNLPIIDILREVYDKFRNNQYQQLYPYNI